MIVPEMKSVLQQLRVLLLAAVLWSVFYAIASFDVYLMLTRYTAVVFRSLYLETLPSIIMWSLLTPVVLALRRHRPIRSPGTVRALLQHAGASIVIGVALFTVSIALVMWRFDLPLSGFFQVAAAEFTLRSLLHFTNYWLILLVAYFLDVYEAYRSGAKRTEALEVALTAAQLSALRARLNPHFLFNTFHSIAALIAQRDNAKAIQMIAEISALLRQSLESQNAATISLQEEIAFAERFLNIELCRFPERIRYEPSVDQALLRTKVPSLILQPLFENAIKHGVARLQRSCHIEFAVLRIGDRVAISLSNDVPEDASPSNDRPSLGVGLATTRDRLRHLYGDAAWLNAELLPTHRFQVELRLPFSQE